MLLSKNDKWWRGASKLLALHRKNRHFLQIEQIVWILPVFIPKERSIKKLSELNPSIFVCIIVITPHPLKKSKPRHRGTGCMMQAIDQHSPFLSDFISNQSIFCFFMSSEVREIQLDKHIIRSQEVYNWCNLCWKCSS